MSRLFAAAFLLLALQGTCPMEDSLAQDLSTGAIEFVATVAPTAGRPEPVRDLSFYLLRKSLDEIRKTAEEDDASLDMQRFIDALDVSSALKQWMKTHDTVQLAGSAFTKLLTAEDIDLAEREYMAAKANSDLNGRGIFAGLAPGRYWITTLNTPALAGDARLRWNVAVSVRPGETARIELSNLNALESPTQPAR
jgi:hypothetical protein